MSFVSMALHQRAAFALRSQLAPIIDLLPLRLQNYLRNQQRLIVTAVRDELRLAPACRNLGPDMEAIWSQENQDWVKRDHLEHLLSLTHNHYVDLKIPEECILQQTVVLPRLAEKDLHSAIMFGLPTWTPFSPEEIFFALQAAELGAQQITVSITFALRSQVQPIIERALQAGLVFDRLVFDTSGYLVALLNPAKARRFFWQRYFDIGLAGAALVLLLGFVMAVNLRLSNELSAYQVALRNELSLLKKEEAAREVAEQDIARRTIVARRRAVGFGLSEILLSIGEQLPPDAALAALEIVGDRGKLEIAGSDASTLHDSLQKATAIANIIIVSAGAKRPTAMSFTVSKVAE